MGETESGLQQDRSSERLHRDDEVKSSRSQEKYKKEVTEYDEQQEKERTEDADTRGNSNDEGTSTRASEKDSNRSRISKELGEAKNKLPQSRANERQHRDEEVKSSRSQEKHKKEVTEYAEQRTENKERAETAHAGGNSNAESTAGSTFEKVRNGSRVSEEVEKNPSGHREDRSLQRLHRDEDEVDFLFDRKNDIFPEKALCYTMCKKRLCCQIHGSRESKSESILLESDILGKLYAVNAKKIDSSNHEITEKT